MRIPLSKVYRAFPELDRFSDEQCRGWQRLANQYWPWKRFVVLCAAALAFPLAWVAMMILIGLLSVALRAWIRSSSSETIQYAVLITGTAVPILLAAVVSFSIRDWWTRRCLRRFIDDRVCGCGYSLLGLPEELQQSVTTVHCPECGTWHRIDMRTGLTTSQVEA